MIPETKDRLTYDAGVAMAGVVAECRRALTTIALAAGLGADATEEEVAARVGEMRGALQAISAWQDNRVIRCVLNSEDTFADGMWEAKDEVGDILNAHEVGIVHRRLAEGPAVADRKGVPCSQCGSTLWRRRLRCNGCGALVCGACITVSDADHGGPLCAQCADRGHRG